jgi:hypothetical protein
MAGPRTRDVTQKCDCQEERRQPGKEGKQQQGTPKDLTRAARKEKKAFSKLRDAQGLVDEILARAAGGEEAAG